MVKRLILLRHATAEFSPATDAAAAIESQEQLFQTSPYVEGLTVTGLSQLTGDRLRPLSKGGHHDAPEAGKWLAQQGWVPESIICSDSLRTRQTCVWVTAEFGELAPTAYLDSRIYDADAARLISIINETSEAVQTLLIVGHMPTVQDVAMRLASIDSDEEAVLSMASNYPTLGLSAFEFEKPWAELDRRDAQLVHFVVPRGK